jgi:hypothetical protein
MYAKNLQSLDRNIRVVVIVTAGAVQGVGGSGDASFFASTSVTAPCLLRSEAAFLLEFAPSFHSDLGTVELAFVFDTSFLGLFTGSLSSVTPREIIELPEGICGQDEIPDRKREEVDQHPHDV